MTEPLPLWALPLIGAFFGALMGSFIATLVIRWPQGRSIVDGRSACDGCGRTLSAIDLVPLASYIVFRGRGRCCGAKIAPLHPITELLATAIGAVAFAVAPMPDAIAGAIFGWTLLTLALLDWRHFWLPERLTIGLGVVGLVVGIVGIGPDLRDRVIGGAIGFIAFEAVRRGYRALRHRDGMGGGDVRLFAAIGLWLGWRPLSLVLLAASLTGLLWCLLLMMAGRRPGKVQFGAFLALAAWAVWIAGQVPAIRDALGGTIGA